MTLRRRRQASLAVTVPEVTGAGGRRVGVIAALGTAQTLAWGSSYYLPAILANPIARDLGISSNWFFAAFSGSLVISGLLGPRVGRQIDRVGGRQVLCLSNLVLAGGLALLGASTSVWAMAAAWLLLGIGMGFGLCDAAFGALGRIFGPEEEADEGRAVKERQRPRYERMDVAANPNA